MMGPERDPRVPIEFTRPGLKGFYFYIHVATRKYHNGVLYAPINVNPGRPSSPVRA